MSSDTHKNWFYNIVGQNIYLWQMVDSGKTSTLAGYKIRLPGDYFGKQLIYPDENITNGLMFEGTAFIEPFVTTDPNELVGNDNPTLTEDTSPSETSHVNLSRMLTLAVVDYIKAMINDGRGEIENKEYYMREFWKKVGDHASNKRRRSMTFPSTPYALR